MAIKYAVLFGKNGVKDGFRKAHTAREFAQMKANRMGKAVEIDKIHTNPRAKMGETDWSQRYYASVKPKRK